MSSSSSRGSKNSGFTFYSHQLNSSTHKEGYKWKGFFFEVTLPKSSLKSDKYLSRWRVVLPHDNIMYDTPLQLHAWAKMSTHSPDILVSIETQCTSR